MLRLHVNLTNWIFDYKKRPGVVQNGIVVGLSKWSPVGSWELFVTIYNIGIQECYHNMLLMNLFYLVTWKSPESLSFSVKEMLKEFCASGFIFYYLQVQYHNQSWKFIKC